MLKFDPQLMPSQLEHRLVYLRPRAGEWLRDELPQIEERRSEQSAEQEVDDLLAAFCSGERLSHDRQIHVLHHVDDGIWELKTQLVRLFGWFVAKDVFVCSGGAAATQVKRHGLYPAYRDQAIEFRDEIDLDPPKFIEGSDPNAVISNVAFA